MSAESLSSIPAASIEPTNAKVNGEYDDIDDDDGDAFHWTAIAILQSIAIFILAGVAEIMGGWLVWAAMRGVRDADDDGGGGSTTTRKRPWYYALLGSLLLVAYGYIPCLQPSASTDGFGRIYAAYGGYFIVLSFLLAWVLEGDVARPDVGDLVGGGIALVGVFVIMFWPGR